MIPGDLLMLKFADSMLASLFLCTVFEPQVPFDLLAPGLSLRVSRGPPTLDF